MKTKGPLLAEASLEMNAPPSRVWEALTTPDLIAKYLFGTRAISNFKPGSPIFYEGEWEGKSYRDKGVVIQAVKDKIFQSTYWSSMSPKQDKPENYALVTYTLEPHEKGTLVKVTQDNIDDEKSLAHSRENWQYVLSLMKKVVEENQD